MSAKDNDGRSRGSVILPHDHRGHRHSRAVDPSRVLIVVDANELSAIVQEAVEKAVSERPRIAEWLGPEDVAGMTGYQKSYISELVRHRGLPCHRAGRKMRFRRSEVREWMEKYGKKK